ncbi:unnamed protein product [Parnassius mnemosyne]|uniref:Reverse transcriptase domain-containing protein n=1 Tax=Parnassius mnemosyne TaxID=213953 RepID=A0AAV1L1U7_9NEOP
MDDLKLFASSRTHLVRLLNITCDFSNSIRIELRTDKCAVLRVERGKVANSEGIDLSMPINIRTLSETETYRYLEIGTNVTENNENNLNTVQLDYDHVDENLPDSAQSEITGKAPIFGQPLPSLDPEFLIALGELVPEQVAYGEDIHSDLAQRWAPILRRGLTEKDQEDKIIKDYATPQNCKLFSAPILNPEIAAAISEFARTRDKKKLKIRNNK